MLMESIQKNVGDKIKGLGVAKVTIAHSKLGGVSQCDYMDMAGGPITLEQAVEIFTDLSYYAACLTLENGWRICFDPYEGFYSLKKVNG